MKGRRCKTEPMDQLRSGYTPIYSAPVRDRVLAYFERLQPLNRSGEVEDCIWNEGRVATPDGFKASYDKFIGPDYGGQGLPISQHLLVDEMICTCSLSFSLYPGLTYGACTALEGYADADLAKLFEMVDLFIVVPRLVEILSGYTDQTVRHG